MNEPAPYWCWEERPAPFPARRLVLQPWIRRHLREFLEYRMCPHGEGRQSWHNARDMCHVIDGRTGETLCLTYEQRMRMERRFGDDVAIDHPDKIPDGEWRVLGAWGHV